MKGLIKVFSFLVMIAISYPLAIKGCGVEAIGFMTATMLFCHYS